MYLINAIYFKGNWTYQFNPEFTQDATFNNLDATASNVPMMSLRGAFLYAYTDEAAFIELPYGDSLYAMTIALPHNAEDFASLLTTDTEIHLAEFERNQSYSTVDLFLPKFELEYKASLNGILQSLGMNKAFLPQDADFSRINAEHDLYISEAIHKTFVEVSEEGTEAAAVTSIGVGTTSIGNEIPPVFRVDKPFLFFIKEKTTGALIFAGKITTL